MHTRYELERTRVYTYIIYLYYTRARVARARVCVSVRVSVCSAGATATDGKNYCGGREYVLQCYIYIYTYIICVYTLGVFFPPFFTPPPRDVLILFPVFLEPGKFFFSHPFGFPTSHPLTHPLNRRHRLLFFTFSSSSSSHRDTFCRRHRRSIRSFFSIAYIYKYTHTYAPLSPRRCLFCILLHTRSRC
jgi:hypothetical protein